jgi:hypothetical protein
MDGFHIDGAFMDGTLDRPLACHLKWPQHLRGGKKMQFTQSTTS